MDRKKTIAWLAGILARALAWVLAVKLGLAAGEAQYWGGQVAGAVGALALAGVSIYSSLKGRKALLAAPPPTQT